MEQQDLQTGRVPEEQGRKNEADVLSRVVHAFQELSPEAQQRVLNAVIAFLGLPFNGQPTRYTTGAPPAQDQQVPAPRFSEDRAPTPKVFLFEKHPTTDVERIACLAYYLTHYMGTPHFKTLDLSKLNTEAAQLKFSNPAQAVDNAAKAGFLVPAAKGAKQLSTLGEQYVQALPDRDAARAAVAHSRPKRRRSRAGKYGTSDDGQKDNE
ncbi:MAG: polyketide synthase [Gammaproteobacteria bacterium]|nr:polyketide synthase [Gammaproteobacteria bacterium]